MSWGNRRRNARTKSTWVGPALSVLAALGACRSGRETEEGTTKGRSTSTPHVSESSKAIEVPRDTWHRDALVGDDWPVDLSWLNAAHGRAGSHGHIQVDGESLRFEDGTPARFWGTNVAARALFDIEDATIAQQAKRLSAFGYNLVRIHHHDSAWTTNVFDTKGGTTQVLDPASLDRLDKWIDALAGEGVYVWLDLHTGREFLPGDGIPGYAELSTGDKPRQAKGFSYLNPRIEELMHGFNDAYLGRVNPYSGKRWADDPSIVGILLTNENDLTHHASRGIKRGEGRDLHLAMLEKLGGEVVRDLGLSQKEARKLGGSSDGRLLLAELQHRWDVRGIENVRRLGAKAPIVTTSFWGSETLWSVPPLAFGDVVDAHSYGKSNSLSTDPHQTSNWIHYIAAAQVAGKPLTVTEWGVPRPEADRFVAPLWVASIASLQGWDALLGYCYGQVPLAAGSIKRSRWEQRLDPAQLALGPTAALMYRRGDVSLAKSTIALAPSLAELWGTRLSPKTAAALRTAPERSRTVLVLPAHPALTWDSPAAAPKDALRIEDLHQDLLPADAESVTSDTGEIERNWVVNVLRIDTPRMQAASGSLGGRTVRMADFEVELDTPEATVSAIALDDKPLAHSELILVTAVARAEFPRDGLVESEPVRGTIRLRATGRRTITAATARSRVSTAPAADHEAVDDTFESPWSQFSLADAGGTHWFLITPK